MSTPHVASFRSGTRTVSYRSSKSVARDMANIMNTRPSFPDASVRIDADVMAWLKSQGKGYQTRLNSILRRAMLDELQKA